MIFSLIGHCPACVGALNVPTGLSSTLFKRYEVFTNWTYSYGKDEHGQLNSNFISFFISRNFNKFSLFFSSPIIYSSSKIPCPIILLCPINSIKLLIINNLQKVF